MYRFLLPTFIICSFAGVVLAQSAGDVVSIDGLLQRYTENYGGLRDSNRLASIRIEGVQVQQGVEYRFHIHKKRPDSLRYQLEKENTTLTSIYNGRKGWLRIQQGSEVSIEELRGSKFEMLKKEARFESPLYRYSEKTENTIRLEGREMIDGIKSFVLRVEEPNDVVSRYYLNPETSNVLRIDRMDEGGGVAFQTFYRDYKKIGGYPFAHEIENRINGETVSLTRVKSISVNPGLLSFYFEKPVR